MHNATHAKRKSSGRAPATHKLSRIVETAANQPQSSRTALVTGIAGQDGTYLAKLLLGKGYVVHGVVKDDVTVPRPNLTDIRDHLTLHQTSLVDPAAVGQLVAEIQPDEIYNLAAPSVVWASWNDPHGTLAFMTGSVTSLLEAIHTEKPDARFFHAASSEIFRGTGVSPQNEHTAVSPTSPYGVGKVAGHALVNAYRERHGMHASSGILFNHESPLRPIDFVPSKIVHAAVDISLGKQDELVLGDQCARRDWGFAGDYVEAMWRMLQHDTPDDYVIATGKTKSVADLVNRAFELVGIDPAGHVRTDPKLVRANDDAQLVGDPTKIEQTIGWRAETSFDQLVKVMVDGVRAAGDD
ncbi:MAG: GDP-mannose 4,6-dehydratase [Solirubrobacterales bacterium]|nr:GDP-mannose 4,6-dehydratase [Solirubrobacterales bacterium]